MSSALNTRPSGLNGAQPAISAEFPIDRKGSGKKLLLKSLDSRFGGGDSTAPFFSSMGEFGGRVGSIMETVEGSWGGARAKVTSGQEGIGKVQFWTSSRKEG